MTKTRTDSRFYDELARAAGSASAGPINTSALLHDKDLALQKAGSLHSYQTFLAQARSWKAARKSVPRSFEREVQLHATQAVADGREIAAATLRSARHLKQAGHLDRVLDSWIAGVKASGPVQVQDLWVDIAEDAQARQTLRDQGLTDTLFAAMDEQMRKMDGQIMLLGGRFAGEVKLTAQAQTQRIVLAHSASGEPRTLHDLLRRGQFEQLVEQFDRGGALAFDLVAVPPREAEIVELAVTGTLFSVQSLAQHKRKLEDTGLATVAGQDPITVLVWVALAMIVIGAIGSAVFCGGDLDQTACTVAQVLLILGLLLYGGLGAYANSPAAILIVFGLLDLAHLVLPPLGVSVG